MESSSSSIRRSYLLALAAIATLTLAAQWAVQAALDRAEGDASVINLAGRQRMLSQKLTKAALSTEFIADEQVRASSSEELSRALELLSSSHVELADAASGDPRTASQYARVDVLFGQLLDAAETVRATEPGSRGQELSELARAEAAFLPEMNSLVGNFESVADGRILRLRRVELALLLATLLVLTLEAFLIFEPLRRALTQRVDELTEARDVAERATRAQDEFLSAMSHEIRTPLNGVIGMSELLLESELTPQQMELAITCNQSSKVLLALVNDVLDYAKLESGEAELEILDVQPEGLLVEVAQLVAPKLSGTSIELIVDGPREPDLNVQADP
ncbi:MAG: histidine kinase dimerization/phospho-acceptor domain-containing protein, partial [Planctomycetota bacterium]